MKTIMSLEQLNNIEDETIVLKWYLSVIPTIVLIFDVCLVNQSDHSLIYRLFSVFRRINPV